jgi:hypothetical protein
MAVTWALVAGLLAIFVGERVLPHVPAARTALDVAGAGALLAMTLWRALAVARSRGAARRVQTLLLAASAGCALAVGLYFIVALKLQPGRLATALTVAWMIALAASAIPLLLTQLTAARGSDEGVEEARVRDAAASGLTVALAAALLFVVGYIASQRDVKVDVSYFRTSLPGSATEKMVGALGEPLRVLLFFPEVNEVKAEVASYFEELARRTGKVQLEAHDRLAAPKLAKQHNVARDGTVVLVKGTQAETLVLDTRLQGARATLRAFDSEVQKALMKVARGARVAYLTTGHGEMSDPPPPGAPSDPMASAQLVRELLAVLNYRVSDLGLRSGLATDVPEDAALVLVLGPRRPFLDEELAALDRYLARGGALLLALDAAGELRLGPLERRLGVRFDPTLIADDRAHLRQRNNPSDNLLLVTDQFSSHAAVTTLSRSRAGAGIIAPSSGSLVDVDLAAVPEDDRPTRTHVVRSMASSFADRNGNHTLDAGEQRASHNLVAAIEAKKMRAFVMASPAMASDLLVANIVLNAGLVADGLKWLGGEEQLAGETTSEKDVPIEHTRSADVAWFYGTIVGAPLLVLGAGLAFTGRRRRRRSA